MQHTATSNLDAAFVLKFVDAHRDVALFFAKQALLELAASHDVAFATNKRAARSLEHYGHCRLFDRDRLHLYRIIRAGDDVANIRVLDSDDRNDISRAIFRNLDFTEILECIKFANLCVALGPVRFHDEHLLLFVKRSADELAHADAAFVAAVIDRADLQRDRTVGIPLRSGNLFEDRIE